MPNKMNKKKDSFSDYIFISTCVYDCIRVFCSCQNGKIYHKQQRREYVCGHGADGTVL